MNIGVALQEIPPATASALATGVLASFSFWLLLPCLALTLNYIFSVSSGALGNVDLSDSCSLALIPCLSAFFSLAFFLFSATLGLNIIDTWTDMSVELKKEK